MMILTGDICEKLRVSRRSLVLWRKQGLISGRNGLHPSGRGRATYWPTNIFKKVEIVKEGKRRRKPIEQINEIISKEQKNWGPLQYDTYK